MGAPSGIDAADLLQAARDLKPWLVEIRRDLHRHPELGLAEHRTSARVAELLDSLGIETRAGLAGGTGLLGTIRGRSEGRVVALRADLDALPIEEANDVPWRSTVPGRMHACGHDAHTAIVLGAGKLLAERRELFDGVVKLVFEPAEETDGGALPLVEEGVLRDPDVDAIFGLHVEPELPVGRVGLHDGHRNAASEDLEITIEGRAGHGAYPADTVDAVVVAAHVVTALQTVVSRNVDARDAAVLTLGSISGGTQRNIVANRVRISGTIRTLDPEIRQRVGRRIREVAEGVAAGFGGRAIVEILPDFEPVINDHDMIAVVRRSAARVLGEDRITEYARPNMGAEDFGVFLAHVPGAFWSLGVRNEERGIVHPLHHERFDLDEDALVHGVAIQVFNVLDVLGGSAAATAKTSGS